ncbi:MAG: hypothetical protein ACFFA6_14130 [Promethearchaeota archaeon]
MKIDDKMQTACPKEYYKEQFKALILDINDNIKESNKMSKI